MINRVIALLASLAFLVGVSTAQFNIFEQMFRGAHDSDEQEQHSFFGGHSSHEPPDWPSDNSFYQRNYAEAHCSTYLCPGTLACVAVPHHCPCAHDSVEDKFELGEGSAICISKGGASAAETARKVDLARKGLL